MANVNLEKLIDLSLLSYYDENIKKFILDKIGSIEGQAVFNKRSELPPQGQEGILYVVEDGILYWNGSEYVDIAGKKTESGGEASMTWGKF